MEGSVKQRVVIIAIASVSAAAIVGVGLGCWFGGVSEGEKRAAAAVSYVSESATQYSAAADVVDAVADSVVEIRTESVQTVWGSQYIVSGAGSGVIVGHDEGRGRYYIVTNAHVVDGANDITVTLRSGTVYPAALVASDEAGDIAVITVAESGSLSMATWGTSSSLRIGEDLIAIGNPLGSLGGTVTKGILSATERYISVNNYTMSLLQTDTPINPGNSGGGLFNMSGELIGIVNAKRAAEEIEGICFAIPADTAKKLYADIVEHGYVVGRATFGITVAESQISQLSSQTVLYVTDAGASPSGTFLKYDKIVRINDTTVNSLLTYHNALASIKPGDDVRVTVCRGSATQDMFGRVNISFSAEQTEFTAKASQLGA